MFLDNEITKFDHLYQLVVLGEYAIDHKPYPGTWRNGDKVDSCKFAESTRTLDRCSLAYKHTSFLRIRVV